MKTPGEHELELAANWAEPENQAEPVPGPAPDKIKNFKFFFQIIKSTTLLDQHVKGEPDSSRFVLEEGGVTFDTNRGTPCRSVFLGNDKEKFWRIMKYVMEQRISLHVTTGPRDHWPSRFLTFVWNQSIEMS